MTLEKPHRLGILSGVAFVVLVVIVFVVLAANPPDLKAPGQDVATFYTHHNGREQTAGHVLVIAALVGAIFVAQLWTTLRWAGSPSMWTGLVLVGGAVCVTGFMVAAGDHIALAEAADKGFGPDGLRVLNAIDSDNYPPFAGGLAILVLATGAAMLGRALVPSWLAWVGIALGIVAFTPAGFFAFVLLGVWLIAVSVLLSRKLAKDSTAAA